MSEFRTPSIIENVIAVRKKRGQTKFSYLKDKKGRIVRFLGWNQEGVWNSFKGMVKR